MWRILYFSILCIVLVESLEKNDYIRIPLFRQKSARENAINSKNLEKLGVNFDLIHKHHKHNSTNGTDAVSLQRFLDMEFYAKVEIGKTGQSLNMVFDTAWQDSWVLSSECDWKEIGCWFHNKYDHTVSSTYIPDGRKFSVSEGTYNLSGYYSTDTIALGHSRVYNQSFVELTQVPSTFILSKMDGLMGLGLRTGSYQPFFYNLFRNKTIKSPIFSVYLNRDRSSSRGGDLYLGFVNKKHIHRKLLPDNSSVPESPVYLPVDVSSGLWKFRMDRVELNLSSKNKTYPFCMQGCSAIADTSNTNIMGPENDIMQIHKLIKANTFILGRYRVNCNTVNILPKINFILSGKQFQLSGKDYIQRVSWGPITVCISAFVPVNQTDWVLGAAFLARYYSIYDIQSLQVGFVRAASA